MKRECECGGKTFSLRNSNSPFSRVSRITGLTFEKFQRSYPFSVKIRCYFLYLSYFINLTYVYLLHFYNFSEELH